MPKTFLNPAERPSPPTYHHAVEVTGPVRTLYLAGQIGLRADGTVPQDFEEEADGVFENLHLALAAAKMEFTDIVRTTVFLTDPALRDTLSKVRAAKFGDHKPASTLIYISGLARPELRLEIEAIAVGDA